MDKKQVLKDSLQTHVHSLEIAEEQKEELTQSNKARLNAQKELDAELNDLRKEREEKSMELNRIRKQLQKKIREHEALNSNITGIALEIEKLQDAKQSLIKDCQVEQIVLPIDNDVVDYSEIDSFEESKRSEYENRLEEISQEIEKLAPNVRATDKLKAIEKRLKASAESFDEVRREAKEVKERFYKVKEQRSTIFMKAFSHIAESIDTIYKKLTRTDLAPLGGTATLNVENSDEPFLAGIKFHTMPPMKRFRDMEQLSGGEKTVAALALLFSIQSFRPSPFFILDEVDAALDNTNVALVANYLVQQSREQSTQFIVISLKSSVYERAQSLVGVYRDQDENCSRILTLKLSDYDE